MYAPKGPRKTVRPKTCWATAGHRKRSRKSSRSGSRAVCREPQKQANSVNLTSVPPLTPLGFRGPCAAGISAAPWRPASSPGLVAPPSALPARQPEPDEGRQDGSAPLSARRLLRERTVLLHPAKAGRQSAAWIAGRGALRPRPRPLPPGTRPSPPSTHPRLRPGSIRPPPRTPPHPRPRICRTPRRSRRERRCVATCARDILQQPSKARLKSCHRDSELIAENSNRISLCVF